MPQQDSNFKKKTSLAIFKQTANMPSATNPVSGMFGASSIGTGVVRAGNSILKSVLKKVVPSPAVIKTVTTRPAPGSGLSRIQQDLEFLKTRPAPAYKKPSAPTNIKSPGKQTRKPK